jgi:transposase InsO family protein
MLLTNGIKPVLSTTKNPQSNAIVERVHKTVCDMISVQIHNNNIQLNNIKETNMFVDSILSSVSFAL